MVNGASHLGAVDAEKWPGVASIPRGPLLSYKARRAEAEFAKACERANLVLKGDPEAEEAGTEPDLQVNHDALFMRIADSGWLGFAESFLAGEWETPDSDRLVKVLGQLIEAGYNPRTKPITRGLSSGGELPAQLVSLYAGDGISSHGGIYSSGVPTTIRESVESFVPGTPKSNAPKSHFVDVTQLSEPGPVDREDLGDAQRRSMDQLLANSHTTTGSHVLVYPASGAQAAIQAAQQRATVDVLSADDVHLGFLQEQFLLDGVGDSIHCQAVDHAIPGVEDWRGRYDAIISVEFLETLSPRERKSYVATLHRLLASEGRAAIQSLISTEAMSDAGRNATQLLQAYIWPGLGYESSLDAHKLVDRYSGLRIVAETHFGLHYATALAQQRSFFAGQLRSAAAAGFDVVYRRLWIYQLALREALLRAGMLDAVQMSLTHRHRGGRR